MPICPHREQNIIRSLRQFVRWCPTLPHRQHMLARMGIYRTGDPDRSPGYRCNAHRACSTSSPLEFRRPISCIGNFSGRILGLGWPVSNSSSRGTYPPIYWTSSSYVDGTASSTACVCVPVLTVFCSGAVVSLVLVGCRCAGAAAGPDVGLSLEPGGAGFMAGVVCPSISSSNLVISATKSGVARSSVGLSISVSSGSAEAD